jgi:hypothetical protein
VRDERYGSFAAGNLAFTVHNPSAHARDVKLTLSRDELRLPPRVSAIEWFTATALSSVAAGDNALTIDLHLPADGYTVVGVTAAR